MATSPLAARRTEGFAVPPSGDLALGIALVVGAVLLGAAVSLRLRQPGSA
jgi:hypothetical protein